MRVLHLSSYDFAGGAGRAAFRLTQALQHGEGEHQLWVRNQSTDAAWVRRVQSVRPTPRQERERAAARHAKVNGYSWNGAISGLDGILDGIVEWAPDVIQMYWVCGDFLSLDVIGSIIDSGVPVVWRLSDLWPVTGGCHYPGECAGYRAGCESCPALLGMDELLSAELFSRKRRWSSPRLTFVAPSKWILGRIGERRVLADAEVVHIPTGVDLGVFSPGKQRAARTLLGLDGEELVLALGTANLKGDGRKGLPLMMEALKLFAADYGTEGVTVLVFGTWDASALRALGFRVLCVGAVSSDYMLASVYSAADIFLLGSTQDNLPNTAIESLACATPVIGFDVGGIPELVVDGETGYLVSELSGEAYGSALRAAVDSREQLRTLGTGGRRLVEKNHDLTVVTGKYRSLYRALVG